LWEERRLAYPIRGHKKGTYWLTYFRIEGARIGPMTEEAQRDDNFLRQLFLKVDPRIVDTLVSHAQQRKEGTPTAGESAESKAADVEDKAVNEDETVDEVEIAAAE
jgi:small subunit ribosomal protein S6